jgi:hypothetical protein
LVRKPKGSRRKARRKKDAYEETIKDAKNEFGRRWRSGLKAKARRKYLNKKGSRIKIGHIHDEEKDIIKASLLAMGSISKRFNTCGKVDCSCMTGGKKHGPYYYLSMALPVSMIEKGHPRMKHFYITEREAESYRERIRVFKDLQDQVWEELWDELQNYDQE